VLVADIRLQGHNGLQLVMLLLEKQPAAACVVVTGHDDPVLRKEAEQLHARYLLKPFERHAFLAAIESRTDGGVPTGLVNFPSFGHFTFPPILVASRPTRFASPRQNETLDCISR